MGATVERQAEKTRNSEDAKRGRKMLVHLDGQQALQILSVLIKKNASTAAAAARTADELFARIIPDEVGEQLFRNLNSLDLEDLMHVSGEQWGGGYVDPVDGAFDLMDDVVQPFLHQIGELNDMGKYDEELVCLEGILLGLQQFNDGSSSEIFDYLQDYSDTCADNAIGAWFKRHPDEAKSMRSCRNS